MNNKKEVSFKERLSYWFDKKMSGGSSSMFKLLLTGTIIVIVLLAIIWTLCKTGTSFLANLWDSFVLTFKGGAGIPDSETIVGSSAGSLIAIILSAIAGMTFTGTVVGIISHSISQKVADLSKGRSRVLETGHTIILGYIPGETALISELIEAADGNPACIVVAEEMDKIDMEDSIHQNVKVPGNIDIICRNINICDPESLKICSPEDAKSIVVSPMEDERAIKVTLSALAALKGNKNSNINIVSIVSDNRYKLPDTVRADSNIVMVSQKNLLSRMIAQSSTQSGISAAFAEVFGFDGSEFYSDEFADMVGKKFSEIVQRAVTGVPVGIIRGGETIVNPAPETIIERGDRLLYFAESRKAIQLDDYPVEEVTRDKESVPDEKENLIIIGVNEGLKYVLADLPENVGEIILAETGTLSDKEVQEDFIYDGRQVHVYEGEINTDEQLTELIKNAQHVVVLNDDSNKSSDPDLDSMMLMLKLRNLRGKLGLDFSITSQLESESNRKLVSDEDPVDFVVASDMASMILAQLTESPELYGYFQEILSDEGNELHLKTLGNFRMPQGEFNVRTLRTDLLRHGYVLLGVLSNQKPRRFCMNPKSTETLSISKKDYLIVIGED